MLSIEHLSAGYGKLTILQDLSMTLQPSRFTALLGANGSGKSTLLKSIFGLADVTAGKLQWGAVDLRALSTETIGQQGIAYVPQRQNVFAAMTVQENLQLATRRLARASATAALTKAQELFPILGQRRGQRAGQLSGGERQLLAIAIGWLTQPQLMLLDEPSAGLSPLFVTEVFRTLRQLTADGLTLLVVEQNARSVLRWCDDAYMLRNGQIVLHGSAAEILADEETVKSYLRGAVAVAAH